MRLGRSKQYLRHETTEKGDRRYQPYLPVAWVEQTRGGCWRGGRRADDVCWWSQHSHQTLEAFNFRQRCEISWGRCLNCFFASFFVLCKFFCDFFHVVSFSFEKLFSFDFSLTFHFLLHDCASSTLQRTFLSRSPFMQHIKLLAQSNCSFVSDETFFRTNCKRRKNCKFHFFFRRTQKSRNVFRFGNRFSPRSGVFFV